MWTSTRPCSGVRVYIIVLAQVLKYTEVVSSGNMSKNICEMRSLPFRKLTRPKNNVRGNGGCFAAAHTSRREVSLKLDSLYF